MWTSAPLTTSPLADGSRIVGARGGRLPVGGGWVVADVTSMKAILLLRAPLALVSDSRPSDTVTVFVASTNRLAPVGVPLRARTPSRLYRYALSYADGSPATRRTVYVPLGTPSDQLRMPYDCVCVSVS